MKALDLFPKLRTLLKPQHLIDINPIAKWFYGDSPKDDWEIAKDFVSLALPFESAWFEYEFPDIYNVNGRHFSMGDLLNSRGIVKDRPMWQAVYVYQQDVSSVNSRTLVSGNFVGQMVGKGLQRKVDPNPRVDASLYRAINRGEEIKWVTVYQPLIGDKKKAYSPGVQALHLDKRGQLIGVPSIVVSDGDSIASEDPEFIGSLLTATMFAISMMHCKNVDMATPKVAPKPRHRKRGERSRDTLVYKTLTVRPMRKSGGGAVAMTDQNAMHFCRGHFKDYRDGNGLFGRHNEVYWWEPQVRGNRAKGQVIKTYKVDK